jgi:hypothetical protein
VVLVVRTEWPIRTDKDALLQFIVGRHVYELKQRNARVFANVAQQFSKVQIIGKIKEEFNL